MTVMDERQAQAFADSLTTSLTEAVRAGDATTAREILRLLGEEHREAAAAAWDAMLDTGGPQWVADHMTEPDEHETSGQDGGCDGQ